MSSTIVFINEEYKDTELIKIGCQLAGIDDIILFNNVLEAQELLITLEDFLLPGLIVIDITAIQDVALDLVKFLKSEERYAVMKIAVIATDFATDDINSFRELEVDGIFIKPTGIPDFQTLCLKLKELAEPQQVQS